jgi:hypothetical protein
MAIVNHTTRTSVDVIATSELLSPVLTEATVEMATVIP